MGPGTVNEIAYFDSTTTVGSLTTATYPSLTEFSYVKGVTSAIQTQFTGKASTTLNNLGTTAINASLLFGADATYDIGSSTVGINDLHLGSGGIINFDGGDVTLTHNAANKLSIAGGNVYFGSAIWVSDTLNLGVDGDTHYFIQKSNDDTRISAFDTILFRINGTDEMILSASALTPNTNDGLALGSTTLGYADLHLASGAVINFNNGDVTITHAADQITLSGGKLVITGGIDLQGGTLYNSGGAESGRVYVNDHLQVVNNAWFNAAIFPNTTDGAAIGSTSQMWSDLFLASGAVINFNNGDVTVTHASNLLTFAGAASGYVFSVPGGSSNRELLLKASVADAGDDAFFIFNGTSGDAAFMPSFAGFYNTGATRASLQFLGLITTANDSGTVAVVTFNNHLTSSTTDPINNFSGAIATRPLFQFQANDVEILTMLASRNITLNSPVISPTTNDTVALGTTSLSFSDLFLASGAVINFNAGNMTITHSAGVLTVAGGTLVVPDDAYDATGWNGNNAVPTKNAIRDKIEAIPALTDGDKGEIVVASSGTVWTIDTAATPQVTKLGIGAAADASRLLLVTGDVSAGVATINRTNAATNAVVGTMIVKGTSAGDMADGFGAAFQFAIQDTAAVENLIADIRGVRNGADNTGKLVFGLYSAGTGAPEMELTLTALSPSTTDGTALGTTALMWSDLFLASGAVINFNNGDVTITHASDAITVAGGDLLVTTAGTASTSVVTISGTQTLTNKTLTSPTLTTPSAFTTGGNITLAENTSIALDPAGSADGKYSGITVAGTGGATIAFGDLVTLDKDDSRWELVDISVAAAATGDARGIIGIAVTSSTNGGALTVLLSGIIRADANFPALTIGAPVYASTTGNIVVAQPTTTDHVIRIIGYALTADEIYFNPGNTWTTHT